MNDLIRRSDIERAMESSGVTKGFAIRRLIASIPAVDAVKRGVYDQVAWERDTALAQLSVIGKGLGEKMDDVAKVVRCRECQHWSIPDDSYGWCAGLMCTVGNPDFYCACGQRREEEHNAVD